MRKLPILLLACACGFTSGCQSAPANNPQNAPAKPATLQVIAPRVVAPGAPGIEGTVVDAVTRAPLSGLYIKLWGSDETSKNLVNLGGMPTDAKGHYKFAVSANKDYKLELPDTQAKNNSYSLLWISVPQVKSAVTQDIARPRRGIVTGSVRDAAGKAVFATVLFQPVEHGEVGHNGSSQRTGADGSFRIEVDVDPFTGAAARYNLSVGDEWNPVQQSAHSTQNQLVEVRPHLQSGDETRVDVVLQPRAIVRGRVTSGGRPVPNCELTAGEPEEGEHFEAQTRTDAQGHYELRVSAPGKWKIVARGPRSGETELTQSEGASTVFNGFGESQSVVECKTPGEVCPVDFALPAPTSLTGRVVGKAGKPVAGATIRVTLSARSDVVVAQTQSGADGTYSLTGLPEGTFSVELVPAGAKTIFGNPATVVLGASKKARLDFDLRRVKP